MRRRTRVFLWVIGSLLTVIVVAVVVLIGIATYDPGPPEFARAFISKDSPARLEETQRAFNALLRARFPKGTDESAIVAALRTEGFRRFSEMDECRLQGSRPAACNGHAMIYRWGSFPCGSSLWVDWSSDGARRLLTVDGQYDFACI